MKHLLRGFKNSETYIQHCVVSDGVDEFAVNKFLSQVFSDDTSSHGKVCSLVKESASRKFDMKEEVLSCTILNELLEFAIKLFPLTNTM